MPRLVPPVVLVCVLAPVVLTEMMVLARTLVLSPTLALTLPSYLRETLWFRPSLMSRS